MNFNEEIKQTIIESGEEDSVVEIIPKKKVGKIDTSKVKVASTKSPNEKRVFQKAFNRGESPKKFSDFPMNNPSLNQFQSKPLKSSILPSINIGKAQ